MLSFTDQIGKELKFDKTPARIVSIVPSQTELICDLGLSNHLIGITKFCIHPKNIIQIKSKVGGTKKIDINKVKFLQPDIIIANKEENEKEQVEDLQNICEVWTSDIHNLIDATNMISTFGEMLGARKKSEEIIEKIRSGFRKYEQKRDLWHQNRPKLSAAYLIWRKPYMVAGGDSFINWMMDACGFKNAFGDSPRYPEISINELKNCDVLLLSSEPFPFQEKHIEELKQNFAEINELKKIPKIVLVDGEIFSWYGSRIALAPSYFEALMKNFVAS